MKTLTRITQKTLLAGFILIISTSVLSALEFTSVTVTQPSTAGGKGSIAVNVGSIPSGETIEYSLDAGSKWSTKGITSGTRGSASFTVTVEPGDYSLHVRVAGQIFTLVKYDNNPIVIVGILAGSVGIDHDGSPQFGEVLTANTSGITNNTGTLHYQWKRDGGTLMGSTSSTYTLAEIDIAGTMTVKVTSDVETGYLESVSTPVVGKANKTAPDAPQIEARSYNRVELRYSSTLEYAMNGGSWQSSSEFTGLTPSTAYSFTQRLKETATHTASYTSDILIISTLEAPDDVLGGVVSIDHDGSPQYGEVLTANTSGITNNTGTFNYQWKRDGNTLAGSTSSTYTLAEIDIAGTMTVKVTSDVETGALESDPTPAVGKANRSAPDAPQIEARSYNSVELRYSSTLEYAVNDGDWQSSSLFSGLTPSTAYSFTQRLKETATYTASFTSDILIITTLEAPIGALEGEVSIDHDGSPQFGEVLTANTSGVTNNTGTLNYQWKRDGNTLMGSTSSTYTLAEIDIAGTMTVKVTSDVETGSLESDPSPAVGKANRSAPDAPQIEARSYNRVELRYSSTLEYAMNDGDWQNSSDFTGLAPSTAYSFTQRLKETATHTASFTSDIFLVSTLEAPDDALHGEVSIDHDGSPQFGEVLTANTSGVTNNTGTLNYQWKRDGNTQMGSTSSTYTLAEIDIDGTITVKVTSDVETGALESDPTPAVGKANKSAPDAPQLEVKTYNRVELRSASTMEYAINGGDWQNSSEFTGLTPSTAYSFTARYKETSTHTASFTSEILIVSTLVAPDDALLGEVSIDHDGSPQFGEVLTANTSGITNNTGTLSYQWKRDGVIISGANAIEYLLLEEDISAAMTVELSSSVESGTLTGGPTESILKADQNAPANPEVESKNHNTIILISASEMEYSVNDGPWQGSPDFKGLVSETSYIFKQRLAETTTHRSSPASQPLILTTGAAPENSYQVTFTVSTDGSNPMIGAEVTLAGYGSGISNDYGKVYFEDVAVTNDILYSVYFQGYQTISGTVSVVDTDVVEELVIVQTGIGTRIKSEIKVYPNPAHFQLTIENAEGQNLSIYSSSGRMLLMKSNCQYRETINVSHLMPGMYIIRTEDVVQKVIIK